MIGVAEGGLANAAGAPLAEDMFAAVREDGAEPDADDNDANGYLDVLGAGPHRRTPPLASPYQGTGDIGLCAAGMPEFSLWPPFSIELTSHGSIVATIAAGRPIRLADASIAPKLPNITFFRLLDNVCTENASFTGLIEPGDFALAFDYLQDRAQVIDISYSVRPGAAPLVIAAMQLSLMSGNKLLVVSAGNDTPGNLDNHRDFCPACLGNPDVGQTATMVLRTVVVGAASRDLRRQAFSNSGARTVWIYAPGEPSAALDVRGQDATPLHAATSYAAPYASLAAALMWSLGIDDVRRVKERLDVATWPLRDEPVQRPAGTRLSAHDGG